MTSQTGAISLSDQPQLQQNPSVPPAPTKAKQQPTLNDWTTIASLGSEYAPFDEKHSNDIAIVKMSVANGTMDRMDARNTAKRWNRTIADGISRLAEQERAATTKQERKAVQEVIKDLNKASYALNRIANGKRVSWWSMLKEPLIPSKPKPIPITPKDPRKPPEYCAKTDTDCSVMESGGGGDNQPPFDLNTLATVNPNTEAYRCCVQSAFLDDAIVEKTNVPLAIIRKKTEALESLSKLSLYYNTRKEFIANALAPNVFDQITTVELVPRNYYPLFVPFDYITLFNALTSVTGVYTSSFSYMFKYVTHASDVRIPDFVSSNYFDNSQNRLIQFLDMPNLQDIHITAVLSSDSSDADAATTVPQASTGISYHVHLNKLPNLISFENSTELEMESIRIHNAPRCERVQNNLRARQIDISNCPCINNLDLVVGTSCILVNLPALKTLSIKITGGLENLHIKGVRGLETLVLKGDVDLGNTNHRVMFDHGTMNSLKTFVIEGALKAASNRLKDSFIYELVRNNSNLTHIGIGGKSVTGGDLYKQYTRKSM